MRLALRILAMIIGVVGAIIAFVVDALYGLAHALGVIDSSHFFIGLIMVALALVGSFLAIPNGTLGAVLLVIATIGMFFVVSWWGLLIAPFLVIAALLAYLDHSRRRAIAV